MGAKHLISFVLPATLVSFLGCTEDNTISEQTQPIINGQACNQEELPQTVALIVDASLNFGGQDYPVRTLMCTGTLIAPDVVLTAAHCVDSTALTGGFAELENAKYYISTTPDLTALSQSTQDLPELPADAMPVSSVVKHPNFTLEISEEFQGLSNWHDIGLVFLETPIADITPAIVMTPEEAKQLEVGDEVRIAGWGMQTPDQGGPAGTKHCATAEIFELGEFEMQIGDAPSTARKCHGDSGGPTFITIETDTSIKERVIGATSRAYDDSDCNKGGVDTLASAWYDWIDSEMKSKCESGERTSCDVDGIVIPSFYDETNNDDSDSGGCNSGRSNHTNFVFIALIAMVSLFRRTSFSKTIS